MSEAPIRGILQEILEDKQWKIERAIRVPTRFENFFVDVKYPIVIPQVASRTLSGNILFEGEVLNLVDAYQQGGAPIICVATTGYLGGSNQLFLEARKLVPEKLLLAKGFITRPREVLELHEVGADALLYIVSAFEKEEDTDLKVMIELSDALGIASVVEIYDERQLYIAFEAGARIIAVNSRNINTGEEDFEGAIKVLSKIPTDKITFLFSGVKNSRDVLRAYHAGAKGVLVCTAIVTNPNPVAKLRELTNQQVDN